MKQIAFCLILLMTACGGENEDTKKTKIEKPEDLKVRNGDRFTEYYPGKKKIKMEGSYDKLEKRHGIWKYYSENGITISVAEYNHGLKNGISMVYFGNGKINYEGQYAEDKPSGTWRFYDEKTGKVINTINYDEKK